MPNLFETVKQSITLREVAEGYGFKVSHSGMIVCPFHEDKYPSMKLNEQCYYCFGCGAKGDVINFVARLFEIRNIDAAKKIAFDFNSACDGKAQYTATVYKKRSVISQLEKQKETYTGQILTQYYRLLWEWEKEYSPKAIGDDMNPKFIEALQQLDYIEYLLDVLDGNDKEEKALLCNNPDIKRIEKHLMNLRVIKQKKEFNIER